MNEFTCQDCHHFLQHYTHRARGNYVRCHCGHCIFPRIKTRLPDTPACLRCQTREFAV